MTLDRFGVSPFVNPFTSKIGEQDLRKLPQNNDRKGTQTELGGEPEPPNMNTREMESVDKQGRKSSPSNPAPSNPLQSNPWQPGPLQPAPQQVTSNLPRSQLEAVLDQLLAVTFDRPRVKEGLFGGRRATTVMELPPDQVIDENLMKKSCNKKIEQFDPEKKHITFAENDTFYKLKSEDLSEFGIYVKLYDFTKMPHEEGRTLPPFLSRLSGQAPGYGITHPVPVKNPEDLADKLGALKPDHQAICRIYDEQNRRYSLLMITNGRPVLFTDHAKGRNIEYQKAFKGLDCYGIFAGSDPNSNEFEQLIRREGPFRAPGTGKLGRLRKQGMSDDDYLKQFKVVFEGIREEQQHSAEFKARPGYVHPENLFIGAKNRLRMTVQQDFPLQDNVDQIKRFQQIEKDHEMAVELHAQELEKQRIRLEDHEIAKKLFKEMNGEDFNDPMPVHEDPNLSVQNLPQPKAPLNELGRQIENPQPEPQVENQQQERQVLN